MRGYPKVDPVRATVAEDVAADLVDLLTGPARLRGRPVAPGDVAVLVRTNRQGALVREALARRRASRRCSRAAAACSRPRAPGRGWCCSRRWSSPTAPAGCARPRCRCSSAGRAASLDADADAVTDRLGPRLRGWADLLAERGVAAFLEVLSAQEQLPARVLSRPDGERLLTDLRHVGQSLHAAALQEQLGLTALVEWLRRRIAQAAVEATDERTRRLESDAAAVQVMTVHVSKGLEFPVVYVPYAWDRWSPDSPDPLRLHDADDRRVLDVGGPDSPGYAAALLRHVAEESGEELRLLYVAMTRAQCQVVAHWAPTRNTPTAPLHRLLLGAPEPGGGRPATVAVPSDAAAQQALEAVAQASGGTVVDRAGGARTAAALGAAGVGACRLSPCPASPAPSTPPGGAPPTARSPAPPTTRRRSPASRRRRARSTSRTCRSRTSPSRPRARPRRRLAACRAAPPSARSCTRSSRTSTPRRSTARCEEAVARRPGSRVDGASARRRAAARAAHAARLVGRGARRRRRRATGWPSWSSSCRSPAATTPSPRRPSPTSPPCCAVTTSGRSRATPSGWPASSRSSCAASSPAASTRVLRLPGPRYVVVDYKTNRLGPEPLTAWHYRPEAMAEAMLRAHYPLQALLYAVALHRFLRWRQPGYDPATPPRRRSCTCSSAGCAARTRRTARACSSGTRRAALVVELSDLLAGASL